MDQLESLQTEPALIASEPPKPTVRRLFFGDDGLRAGWSVLLFLVLIAAIGASMSFVIAHYHLLPKRDLRAPQPLETPFRPQFISESLNFLLFALAAWVLSLIEKRPFTRYGLTTRRMPTDFLIGLGWGLLFLSVLVGVLVLTHTLAFDGVLLHGRTAILFALKWGLGFLLVGLLEEFHFRGYLQYTVARGVAGIARALSPGNRHTFQWGFWVTAFLFSGLFFMLAHTGNPGETFCGIIGVGLAGAVFAFSLYRTGSLWWAIGFHTSWDWAQSYLYGVRDSGTMVQGHLLASHAMGRPLLSGSTDGPEGSLFIIPTLLAVGIIIHYTLPKRDYPLTLDQSPLQEPAILDIASGQARSSI